MVEAAVALHVLVQLVFACMAERRVTEVVGQGDGLGQVVVQPQGLGDGAGDLRHFQRMGEARAEVVALVRHEHLGLFLQAAEGRGVDDAVAVAGERRPGGAVGFRKTPAARARPVFGIGRPHGRLVDQRRMGDVVQETGSLFRRSLCSLI